MIYNKAIVLKLCIFVMCLVGGTLPVRGGADHTCPSDEFPTRFAPGFQGITLEGVTMYGQPISIDPVIAELAPGTRFTVVDWGSGEDPCYDEMRFVYVETGDGVSGWIIEVFRDRYLLEPLGATAPLSVSNTLSQIAQESFAPGQIDYNGVHFSVDPSLATQVSAEFVPVSDERGYLPAHLKFLLTPTDQGPLSFMVIRVMSAQDVNNFYPGAIESLRNVLNGVEGSAVPFDLLWAFSDSGTLAPPHEGITPLGNGKARWALMTGWQDETNPSDFLVNSIMGLSDDEQYYIQATFTTYYKDLSIYTPPLYEGVDDINTVIEPFHQNIFNTIAAATDSDFTPRPSQVQALLSTLTVDPGTLQEIVTEANIVVNSANAPLPPIPTAQPTDIFVEPTSVPQTNAPIAPPLKSDCPAIPVTDYIEEENDYSWTGEAFNIEYESSTITIDPGTTLDLGEGDFSASVWVYLSSRDPDGVVFDKRYEFETVQGIVLTASYQRLIFQMADGISGQKPYETSWSNYSVDTPVSVEKWHLINVVVDRDAPDGGQIYLDGQLVLTFDPTSHQGSLDTTVPLMLGQRSSSDTGYLQGLIKDLRFYRCLLTPEQIAAAYAPDLLSPGVPEDFANNFIETSEAVLGLGYTAHGYTDVVYGGVHLNVEGFTTQVDGQFIPASDEQGYTPAHITLSSFSSSGQGWIAVSIMSAQEMENHYPGTMTALRNVLDGVPDAEPPTKLWEIFAKTTPFGPPLQGIIPLGNGKAYWSLGYVKEGLVYETNGLRLSMFGLSDDGQYYIDALAGIVYQYGAPDTPPPYWDPDNPALVAQHEAFHRHILDTVTTAPDSDFTPSIGEMWHYMATIFVDPMTLPQTVAAANAAAETLLVAPTAVIPTHTPTSVPTTAPTATLPPTWTPTPTLTPTPLPVYCPASPPSRIQANTMARVTISGAGEVREDLRVRATPGGERIGSMAEGTEFRVTGTYQCVDDRIWWPIQTIDGALTGWVTEGAVTDDYYIEPLDR